MPTDFTTHQLGIYLNGVNGDTPPHPVRYDDLVSEARHVLGDREFGYVIGAAGGERSPDHNREAFARHRLVPRMLRDVSQRDLTTTVLNTTMDAPVMIAPVGVQGIMHDDAEAATARAAAVVGTPLIVSTVSTLSMEAIAEAHVDGDGNPGARWFQLYWPADRELAASFVRRAEAAGYEAIVVTLDAKFPAWKPWDIDTAYLPPLHGHGMANYLEDPVFRAGLPVPPEEDMTPAIFAFAGTFADKTLTWGDLAWLREQTDLPIVLKGILHPDDARLALDHGADGIVVSNHGGRFVDNTVGALDMLPQVVEVVDGAVPVLFDSGIRTGADVVTALALGADAVCVGRPFMWGLALGGQTGVEHVLRCLLADTELTMALVGASRPSELGPDVLA